jgi:hypothetical protein
VQYGGTERTPILGTGTIVMRITGNGASRDIRIPNVRLMKMAQHTLLSARQLLHQMGAHFHADGKTGSLTCDGRELLCMTVQHDLFVVQCELIPAAKHAMRHRVQSTAYGPRTIAHCIGCAAGKATITPPYVPDVRGKLAPRSSHNTLVGYASPGREKNAVYHVWNTAQGKVEEATDVHDSFASFGAPAAPAPPVAAVSAPETPPVTPTHVPVPPAQAQGEPTVVAPPVRSPAGPNRGVPPDNRGMPCALAFVEVVWATKAFSEFRKQLGVLEW